MIMGQHEYGMRWPKLGMARSRIGVSMGWFKHEGWHAKEARSSAKRETVFYLERQRSFIAGCAQAATMYLVLVCTSICLSGCLLRTVCSVFCIKV